MFAPGTHRRHQLAHRPTPQTPCIHNPHEDDTDCVIQSNSISPHALSLQLPDAPLVMQSPAYACSSLSPARKHTQHMLQHRRKPQTIRLPGIFGVPLQLAEARHVLPRHVRISTFRNPRVWPRTIPHVLASLGANLPAGNDNLVRATLGRPAHRLVIASDIIGNMLRCPNAHMPVSIELRRAPCAPPAPVSPANSSSAPTAGATSSSLVHTYPD